MCVCLGGREGNGLKMCRDAVRPCLVRKKVSARFHSVNLDGAVFQAVKGLVHPREVHLVCR